MAYPTSLDALTDPAGAQQMNDPVLLHSVVEKAQNDAIEAVQATLGLNPQGGSGTVVARLNALDALVAGKASAAAVGAASGIASLDSGSRLSQNVDASHVDAGTLVTARIPNLDAAKLTSGVLALARIPTIPLASGVSGTLPAVSLPNHDAALITTGTIAAARLPSSVTANANARVVADQAARDAIPLVDRADGMFVLQRTPQVLWEWRADNSTWVEVGGAGYVTEPEFEAYDATILTTSVTAFDPGAPGLSQVFTAPASGRVMLTLSSLIIITVGTGQGYFGAEVRAGNSIGSGTIMDAVATQKCVAVGGATGIRTGGSIRYRVNGLTPGSVYHVRTMFTTSNSPTATMQLFYRRALVEMVH